MNSKALKLKKAALLALLLPMLLGLSGCWSYHELNERSYVVAIGFDKGSRDGSFKFIEQIAMPSGISSGSGEKSGGGGSEAFWNIENEGETVFSTLRHITHIAQRKPFFAHIKVVVFGKDEAEVGVHKYLDLITRDSETRISPYMVVAKERAIDILNSKPHLDKVPADKIEKVLNGWKYTSEFKNVQIRDFLNAMLSKSKVSVVPMIEQLEQTDVKKSAGKSESSSDGEGEKGGEEEKDKILKINNSAVFKDYRMIGELDNIECRGLGFVTNNVEGGIVVIPSPENADEKLDIELSRCEGIMKPVFENEKLRLDVKINTTAYLGAEEGLKNYADTAALSELEKGLESAIKNEIEAAFKKARELNADIFGVANAIFKENPKKWAELESGWDDTFKSIEPNITVDAEILGTAIIKSLSEKESEGV